TIVRHTVLTCCPFTDIKKLPWDEMLSETWVGDTLRPPELAKFLRKLAPDWISDWAQWLFEQRATMWGWSTRWSVVFTFVQAGQCKKPQSDVFAIEMVSGCRNLLGNRRSGG